MILEKQFSLEITLIPSEDFVNGRSGPLPEGIFATQFYYDNHDWDIRLHGYFGSPRPGQTFRTFGQFLSPEAHRDKLFSGSHFLLREGSRITGYGHVVEVYSINTVQPETPQPISPEDVQAIKERSGAATPGPWISYIEGRDFTGGSTIVQTPSADIEMPGIPDPDVDFIAHARADIPRLLSALEFFHKFSDRGTHA